MTKKEAQLQDSLSNPFLNSRGDHFIADCPFCSKEKHLYVNFKKAFKKKKGKFMTCWDCKRCSEKGSIYRLLKQLKALWIMKDDIVQDRQLEGLKNFNHEEENYSLDLPNKKMPMGWERVFSDDYLEGRGFTEYDFNKYRIGYTKLKNDLKSYVIIAVEQYGDVKGYMGRSILTTEEIKEINDNAVDFKYPRYRNSKETEFNKMLMGLDEINFLTETVILVEGFFDKNSVDNALSLNNDLTYKCCSSFGKDVSKYQIELLKSKGVKNICVVFDPDALKNMEELIFRYSKDFDNIFIGVLTGDSDLNEMSNQDILSLFSNDLIDFFDFRYNIVKSKIK